MWALIVTFIDYNVGEDVEFKTLIISRNRLNIFYMQWDEVGSNEFIEKSNCSRKNCLNFYVNSCGALHLSCEITLRKDNYNPPSFERHKCLFRFCIWQFVASVIRPLAAWTLSRTWVDYCNWITEWAGLVASCSLTQIQCFGSRQSIKVDYFPLRRRFANLITPAKPAAPRMLLI